MTNYHQNSIHFRREIYKLVSLVENGGLALDTENVKNIKAFLNGTLMALNMYEKPIQKEESTPKLTLVKNAK